MVGRGLFVFALLITAGLTLILGRPASSQRRLLNLEPIVVSRSAAEPVIRSDTLRRGEVLAQVLARQGLNPNQTATIVERLREYVNPRVLRAGVTVEVRRTPWDSVTEVAVRYSPDNVVHFEPEGSIWISELEEVPVRIDTMVIAGSINSSLYNSVLALPYESMAYAERVERLMWGIHRPFQWSIDFGVGLRKGDTYRVVYERHVRSNGSVRASRVLAAEFVNRGRVYEAFWYPPRREYFAGDGESMKRLFLKAPVDFRRISSRFSRRRYHPKLGVYRAHLGTDYAAAPGTPVRSTADGTVTRANWWGGYGRVVEVRHINGYLTRYAHLSFVAKGIRPGVRVRQNQLIGYVGSSGLATGPHLHYELLQYAKAIDHRSVDLPSGEPVARDQMSDFLAIRDRHAKLLNLRDDRRATLAE